MLPHREEDKCSPVSQAAIPLPWTGAGDGLYHGPHPGWPCQSSQSSPGQSLLGCATRPRFSRSGNADFANRANASARSGGHTARVPELPPATDISVQGHASLLYLKSHTSARGWGSKIEALTLPSEVPESGLLFPNLSHAGGFVECP